MNCQNMFSWKNKKKYFNTLSADNFTQHAKHWNKDVVQPVPND